MITKVRVQGIYPVGPGRIGSHAFRGEPQDHRRHPLGGLRVRVARRLARERHRVGKPVQVKQATDPLDGEPGRETRSLGRDMLLMRLGIELLGVRVLVEFRQRVGEPLTHVRQFLRLRLALRQPLLELPHQRNVQRDALAAHPFGGLDLIVNVEPKRNFHDRRLGGCPHRFVIQQADEPFQVLASAAELPDRQCRRAAYGRRGVVQVGPDVGKMLRIAKIRQAPNGRLAQSRVGERRDETLERRGIGDGGHSDKQGFGDASVLLAGR